MARVLFGLRSLVGGGVETTALTLHRHLHSPHWKVWLALLEDYGELQEQARSLRGILRPRWSLQTAPQREDLRFALMAVPRVLCYGWRMRSLLARMRPEVVFTHSGLEFLAILGFLARPAPAVWAAGVGSDALLDALSKHPHQERFLRWALRLLYRSPDYVVTASQGLARVMLEEHGLRPERVQVIPNPVELDRLRAPAPVPSDVPPRFVLGVGRLAPVKGFDVLLRAVAQVSKEVSPLPLVLLGEGPERGALAMLARQLDYAHLSMPGFVASPWAYMRAAQVVVVPSRIEGFSNVTVEAMACGTPVIVTDCPHGPREIVSQGQDGLVVGTGDVSGLARTLASLLQQPEMRDHYARRGLARAEDFDAPRIATQYFDFLDRVKAR